RRLFRRQRRDGLLHRAQDRRGEGRQALHPGRRRRRLRQRPRGGVPGDGEQVQGAEGRGRGGRALRPARQRLTGAAGAPHSASITAETGPTTEPLAPAAIHSCKAATVPGEVVPVTTTAPVRAASKAARSRKRWIVAGFSPSASRSRKIAAWGRPSPS